MTAQHCAQVALLYSLSVCSYSPKGGMMWVPARHVRVVKPR